jgi:hypothetical protein
LCETNHVPATACDPQGPRPFLHAGVDVLPAADRAVRASAPGLVVWARPAAAAFAGRRAAEGGGTVILQHDLDGDAATPDDRLTTIYGHVEPLVGEGRVVSEGEVIARTVEAGGGHLHFGARRVPFSLLDPVTHHAALPPPGTDGCLPCYSRQAPLPAFPESWEDPASLFRAPTWARLLKSGLDQEGGGDVLEVGDGYVIAGWTRGANIGGKGALDAWIARMNATGDVISQHAYGGEGIEQIFKLAPAADGGFVALAHSGSFGASTPAPVLMKFDAAASHPQWQKMYVGNSRFWADDLQPTSDGAYVLSGAMGLCLLGGTRCVTVLKVDADGNVAWARSYPVLFYDVAATSIVETTDGGLALACDIFSPGSGKSHLLILRLDANGTLVWSYTHQVFSSDTHPRQIQATNDGGVVIVGTVGHIHLWLLKLLHDGAPEWEFAYSFGSPRSRAVGARLTLTPEGGYVVSGQSFSHIESPTGAAQYDIWLLKLDAGGRILRQRAFDARGQFDTAVALRTARDGGLILVGGQGETCPLCSLLPSPNGLLVVRADADLQASDGCGTTPEGVSNPIPSQLFSQEIFPVERTVAALPVEMTVAPSATRSYACAAGSYGPPPDIQAVTSELRMERTSCDFTHILVAQLCGNFGVAGVTPSMPIILEFTNDVLWFEARVSDRDSTLERSDIERVEILTEQPPFSDFSLFPLADDGSEGINYVDQVSIQFGGKDCFYDPGGGLCVCASARYPTRSGDATPADGVYSRDTALITPISAPADGVDCFLAARGRPLQLAQPAEALDLRVRAVDHQGNVTIWPHSFRVTPNPNAAVCSGDECGCCLLLNPASACAGKPGLTSPDFPQGLCSLF